MAFGGVGGSAATVGDSPVYRWFLGCAAVDVYRIFHSGILWVCPGGMAISECPSCETHPVADISLIAENRGVIVIPKYSNPQNLSSAHLIFGLLCPAAKVLSLGFRFGARFVLGKRG